MARCAEDDVDDADETEDCERLCLCVRRAAPVVAAAAEAWA